MSSHRPFLLTAPRGEADFGHPNFPSATVSFLGGSFHLSLIRVHDVSTEDGVEQRAFDPDAEHDLDLLFGLHSTDRFETISVPGLEGDFVCYMLPFGD